MDPERVANVFELADREIWVVTAAHDGRQNAMIATFFTQASIVPELPRVIIGLSKESFTRELIEHSRALALHLIDEAQLEWVWRFGLETGRSTDKLSGIEHTPGETGAPILGEAVAYLECRVEDRLDTGDRSVYLAAVVAGRVLREEKVLTARRLFEIAPDDKRRELKRQVEHDAQIDAAAIREWRRSSGS